VGDTARVKRVFVLVFVAAVAACAQNDDPAGAKDLYTRVSAGAGFRAWQRAPNFPFRKPSFTDHSDAVEVFVNPIVSKALAGPDPVMTWPVGSIIVKESYADNTKNAVAIIEKKTGGTWFWAEYDADGKAIYSGHPDVCINCHKNREGYSDWVYSFEFPK
jgi:hypothetical protein